jgi:ATP-dependent DNA ligase
VTWSTHTGALAQQPCRGENGFFRIRLPAGIAPISGAMSAYQELKRRINRTVTFEPCLPRPAKAPPNGSGWIHEIKHDGFRIIAQKDVDGVQLITRNGYDFAERYPLIVDAIRRLSVKSCIVDGEALWSIRKASRSLTSSVTDVMTMPRRSVPST